MEQIVWIIDYEEDVASDLSAFHRVDDPMTLDAARYFSLAARLTAYAGILQARVLHEREKGESAQPHAASGPAAAREPASRVSDDVALAMLAGDDWAPERVTEGASA